MGFGIFGKLPQKRDFIALNLPRAVLEPFENWLQSAIAASRNELGTAWQDLYLVSPIWRFWIGGDILTTACAGALMPSVDSVGRFFPLAIIYHAEPGEVIVPPPFDPLDVWPSPPIIRGGPFPFSRRAWIYRNVLSSSQIPQSNA